MLQTSTIIVSISTQCVFHLIKKLYIYIYIYIRSKQKQHIFEGCIERLTSTLALWWNGEKNNGINLLINHYKIERKNNSTNSEWVSTVSHKKRASICINLIFWISNFFYCKYHSNTVEPVLSGHPLLNGQFSKSQKLFPLMYCNFDL